MSTPGIENALEHLSNWFADSASWRTAILLTKRVLHGHTVGQTALELSDLNAIGTVK
ncbi:hypothetical protein Mal48_37700 [Thalassoglobus polymorphus]|uniref:Uncharacterized protein n=1 Tax=Thalassoglobus polymorphus TaxID=2527994 RepID=A0A517QSA2_9PLAN|nr:hypothetical protein Mal48_37700 [Thalassoglobus polymorphus]